MLSQGVKVDLPQADSTPIPQDDREPLVITVDASGAYYASLGSTTDRPLAIDALLAQMQGVLEAQPGLPVYVKGDRNVAYGRVVELLALIRDVVPSVGLMTETPEEK
jgi:biopolymer transport protein TolR